MYPKLIALSALLISSAFVNKVNASPAFVCEPSGPQASPSLLLQAEEILEVTEELNCLERSPYLIDRREQSNYGGFQLQGQDSESKPRFSRRSWSEIESYFNPAADKPFRFDQPDYYAWLDEPKEEPALLTDAQRSRARFDEIFWNLDPEMRDRIHPPDRVLTRKEIIDNFADPGRGFGRGERTCQYATRLLVQDGLLGECEEDSGLLNKETRREIFKNEMKERLSYFLDHLIEDKLAEKLKKDPELRTLQAEEEVISNNLAQVERQLRSMIPPLLDPNSYQAQTDTSLAFNLDDLAINERTNLTGNIKVCRRMLSGERLITAQAGFRQACENYVDLSDQLSKATSQVSARERRIERTLAEHYHRYFELDGEDDPGAPFSADVLICIAEIETGSSSGQEKQRILQVLKEEASKPAIEATAHQAKQEIFRKVKRKFDRLNSLVTEISQLNRAVDDFEQDYRGDRNDARFERGRQRWLAPRQEKIKWIFEHLPENVSSSYADLLEANRSFPDAILDHWKQQAQEFIVDEIIDEAPDIRFDVDSHVSSMPEQQRDQIAAQYRQLNNLLDYHPNRLNFTYCDSRFDRYQTNRRSSAHGLVQYTWFRFKDDCTRGFFKYSKELGSKCEEIAGNSQLMTESEFRRRNGIYSRYAMDYTSLTPAQIDSFKVGHARRLYEASFDSIPMQIEMMISHLYSDLEYSMDSRLDRQLGPSASQLNTAVFSYHGSSSSYLGKVKRCMQREKAND